MSAPVWQGHYEPPLLYRYVRPVYSAFLWSCVHWLGKDPWACHATLLALHGGVTLLLAAWLRMLLQDGLAAWLGAALFAVHPLHVESVAWIAGACDVLGAMFLLLAGVGWLRWREAGGGYAWLGLAGMGWLGAAASKEMTFLGPAVLLGVELLRHGRETGSLGRRLAPALLGLGIVGGWVGLRLAVWGGLGGYDNGLTPLEALAAAPWILRFYLTQMLCPLRPAPVHSFHLAEWSWLAWGLALALGLAGLGAARRSLAWSVLGLWSVAFLAPLLDLRQFDLHDVLHDRYTYIPTLGVCGGLGLGLGWIWRRRPAAGLGLACLMLGGFLTLGWRALPDYREDRALFEAAIRAFPESRKYHLALAHLFDSTGQRVAALAEVRAALGLDPDYSKALLLAARLELGAGRVEEAARLYSRIDASRLSSEERRQFLGLRSVLAANTSK